MCRRNIALLFTTICLAACARGERYSPVNGVVLMDGQPLSGVIVVFEPLPNSGSDISPGTISVGKTDQEGRFSLKSPRVNRAGAAVGTHRVRILTPNEIQFSQQEIDAARKKIIAREKADGGAASAISDDKVIEYLSEHSTKNVVEPIPARYNQQTELRFEVSAKHSNDAKFELQSN